MTDVKLTPATSTASTTAAADTALKDGSKAADLPAADDFSPSGAPHQVTDFDMSHPAVDANPRANTSVVQNQIDFNDPTLSASEAVAKNLKDQSTNQSTKISADTKA